MRSFAMFILLVAACDASTTSATEAGAPPVDASTNDAAPSDGGAADGSSGEAGTCALMGTTYDKACGTATDCSMVARGCYCGAQPIIGVAKNAQPSAQACESDAANRCTLGCANFPGHVAEDGQNDEGTGRNIQVQCDAGSCYTFLAP